MNFVTRLEKQNKAVLVLLGLLLIGVIGILDFLTGYELSFSVFYVLPITLIAWLTSRRFGLLVSLLSAVVWLVADRATGHLYLYPLIPIWNTFIRFTFFVIITSLVYELRNALQREREQARRDYLTGAVNARFFYELLQMEVDRFERYKRSFTVAFIDLDKFKALNDRLGHATGDRVLRTLTDSVRGCSRKTDIFARIGGDEFVLLLPETNQEMAQSIIPRIQGCILNTMQKNNWPITLSIGVLTCNVSTNSLKELLHQADVLMYQAKLDQMCSIKYAVLEMDLDPARSKVEE